MSKYWTWYRTTTFAFLPCLDSHSSLVVGVGQKQWWHVTWSGLDTPIPLNQNGDSEGCWVDNVDDVIDMSISKEEWVGLGNKLTANADLRAANFSFWLTPDIRIPLESGNLRTSGFMGILVVAASGPMKMWSDLRIIWMSACSGRSSPWTMLARNLRNCQLMYLVQVDDSEWGYEISLVESYSLLITWFSICRTLADQWSILRP